MQKDALNNVHITDEHVLMTPEQLKTEFPLSVEQEAQIAHARQTISDIIAGRDPRLLVVCGLAPFTIRKLRLNMLVGLKPLPQRSAIASTW